MIEITPSVNNKNTAFNNTPNKINSASKGYLVHEKPLQAAKSTIKEYVKTAKYTINAVNGEGDDYSVGKINDLTLRLGSFGIAATLASMTRNPALKTMEFAGFASFFAAMAIWPKLFIAAPLKQKTGFNVNQQYVDSYDRRKRFFEDPQYLPWDLYNDDEINKIGDKLKIPRNIENRENHIKEKMKQIAIQSNTLWMLTAGFSTPLMASLMGNYISKYVRNVVETSRAKASVKEAGLADFTKTSQNTLQKIFVNPLANLTTLFKEEKGSNSFEQSLKTLDNAYDSIFGKADEPEYEYNKARLLYENVDDDKLLTQYDSNLGATVVKDANGKIIRTIKTKNYDGISIFGNKWQEIPNKLVNALGVTPKKYKEIMNKTLKANQKGITPNESDALADMLINEFGGSKNAEKVEKALKQMEKILTPSIEELEEAKNSFDEKLATIKSGYQKILKDNNISPEDESNIITQKIKFIVNAQQERLTNKVVNTKASWFSPVRILDIIAQQPDETFKDAAKTKELKEVLSQFIYGVTPHQINNNFDTVIKGDYSDQYRYTAGIDKFFSQLSDKTEKMFGDKNKFIKTVNDNTNWQWNKLYNVANEKGKHFESICSWLGKTPYEFIEDATKQTGIYKGWLKKVGISFAALTSITLLAISQFGKTNKYNPDIYKDKKEQSKGV